MNKELDAYRAIATLEMSAMQDEKMTVEKAEELRQIIEKELEDYQEIKEIAKHYNWDVFTSKIFNVETDKKYRDLFNSAIVSIQEDYRKARAFEIIKDKNVDVHWVKICKNSKEYNEEKNDWEIELTQEEFNLLKKVLL